MITQEGFDAAVEVIKKALQERQVVEPLFRTNVVTMIMIDSHGTSRLYRNSDGELGEQHNREHFFIRPAESAVKEAIAAKEKAYGELASSIKDKQRGLEKIAVELGELRAKLGE